MSTGCDRFCMCVTPEKRVAAYFDSSAPAFADGVGHSSTRRVDHGHEADEAQVLSGEVHLLRVESKVLRELVVRQAEMAETWKRTQDKKQFRTRKKCPTIAQFIPIPFFLTQDSLSQTSQFQVCVLESVLHLVVQRLLFALHHDGGAAVQNPLRSALHHQQVLGLSLRGAIFVHGELGAHGQVEHTNCVYGVLDLFPTNLFGNEQTDSLRGVHF